MSRSDDAMLNNIFKNSTVGNRFGAGANRDSLSSAFSNPTSRLNNLGYVPSSAGQGYQDHVANKSIFTTPGSASYNAQHNNKFQQMGDQRVSSDRYANIRKFRNNIDFEDKESIKELQGYLGVEQDGMFGPKTERAWRQAVAGMDKADAIEAGATPEQAEQEVLRYDWNEKELADRVAGSRWKLGGKLKEAWTNLDEKVFKGKLPGGYNRGISDMSAEDYYASLDKAGTK
ncbi:MAG: hypothetical protein Unbinned5123contig1000_47 [Prokaryotic dsDNA virus sp.]|nr:MAG: hypothetical protein Unbinned5123contig1000_47 [Prokaryotic dsDNA virus sp.]|tara:strand:+ start:6316 stop:7005 length:690 start_codon:yes stop_codon:yes gene_type:complete